MNLRALNHGLNQANYLNYVTLGLGGTFTLPIDPTAMPGLPCAWRFSDSVAWSHTPIRNYRQGDIIYAFPITSEVARINRQNVEFYNTWVVGNTLWMPFGGQRPLPLTPLTTDLETDDEDEDEDEEELDDDEFNRRVADMFPGDTDPDGDVLTLETINFARRNMNLPPLVWPAVPVAPGPEPAPTTEPTPEPQLPSSFVSPEGQAKLFCLTFNGVPLASIEEFTDIAGPLLESSPSTAVHRLWAAQWNENPEAVMDSLMDSEPVLVACAGFVAIPQPIGVAIPIQEVAAPEGLVVQPMAGLIVRAAAGALLSGGMSNHFSFNETGSLVINPENPPTLTQGYAMMARVFSVEETGDRLKNFSRWSQGGLLAEMIRFYGDGFNMDQLCEATERSYNTLNACLNTHLRWAHRKRESLSWTHHKEVEFSTLTEDQKEWVLDQSVRLALTVADQRKVQSFVIRHGIETFIEDMPEDRASMLERLEVRSVNRNFMFMLQGLWYSYRGPFEHIPNGAAQILNADTRQVLDREGHASNPREWVPVGIEIPFIRGHGATNQTGIEEARETGEVPRRAHGGNTHLALGATGPDVTGEDALVAAAAADAILDEPAPEPEAAPEAAPEVAPAPALPPNRPDASNYQFVYPDFWNEPGARLLMGMEGYPEGMPEELQELLDAARLEEFENTNGNRPRTQRAFNAFLQASDDHLVPF